MAFSAAVSTETAVAVPTVTPVVGVGITGGAAGFEVGSCVGYSIEGHGFAVGVGAAIGGGTVLPSSGSISVVQFEPCGLQQLVQQLHVISGAAPRQSATNSKNAISLLQKVVSKLPAKIFPFR